MHMHIYAENMHMNLLRIHFLFIIHFESCQPLDTQGVPVSSHQDQGVDADGGRGEDQELIHLPSFMLHV